MGHFVDGFLIDENSNGKLNFMVLQDVNDNDGWFWIWFAELSGILGAIVCFFVHPTKGGQRMSHKGMSSVQFIYSVRTFPYCLLIKDRTSWWSGHILNLFWEFGSDLDAMWNLKCLIMLICSGWPGWFDIFWTYFSRQVDLKFTHRSIWFNQVSFRPNFYWQIGWFLIQVEPKTSHSVPSYPDPPTTFSHNKILFITRWTCCTSWVWWSIRWAI